jgi:membrane-associated protein
MFNVEGLIISGGILIVAAIVFAESGLLIGFFLPGDTLLFSAGLLASQGYFPITWLIFAIVVAAVIGDNVGYTIGRRTGHRIFNKQDGLLFHKGNLLRAQKFYEEHGGKTVTLARFVPVIRTFAPMLAGVGKMERRKFMLYNIVGAVLWGGGVTLLGYFLGSQIPGLDKYIEIVLVAIVVLSLAGSFLHLVKDKHNRQILLRRFKRLARSIMLNKRVD